MGWSKHMVVVATATVTVTSRMSEIVSAANCNGCIYVLGYGGHVSRVDTGAPPPLRLEKVPEASLIYPFIQPCMTTFSTSFNQLVESDGEILLVRTLFGRKLKELEITLCIHSNSFPVIAGFEVYRLDVMERRRASVEALPGDQAVFMSPESSFAVRASETEGCRSNCVYFVSQKPYCFSCRRYGGATTWGVYSMEQKEVLFEQAVTRRGSVVLTPCLLYIVYMGQKMHDDPSAVTASHHDMLASVLGSKDEAQRSMVYTYKHGFSGFAAMLTESQARTVASLPGVITVKANTHYQTHTTRSWDFLGLDHDQSSPSGLLKKAKYGEDIIVGVVDTGIWPESRSFDDSGYGPLPARWRGTCQTGTAFNATSCNRKIIGPR
ncbi:subtilisin-like protease SBT3.3 [Panicum miliaceum]|uniref:Subtilisin-like protease SBT3.3 n=1 Tax=Panicum miliaceum TaxID=4540 RepID=A0A3L6RRV1_PANMI|nr:subtilisin-like protease SBT3.3 [Panicum miliaceum]